MQGRESKLFYYIIRMKKKSELEAIEERKKDAYKTHNIKELG
jgi:hypothetical protein